MLTKDLTHAFLDIYTLPVANHSSIASMIAFILSTCHFDHLGPTFPLPPPLPFDLPSIPLTQRPHELDTPSPPREFSSKRSTPKWRTAGSSCGTPICAPTVLNHDPGLAIR